MPSVPHATPHHGSSQCSRPLHRAKVAESGLCALDRAEMVLFHRSTHQAQAARLISEVPPKGIAQVG